MIQDKFTKETSYSIDYNDLDKILRKEYDCPNYECALDQSNGSTIRIDVDGEFTELGDENLQEYFDTKSQDYSTTDLLMNDLCRKGKLEPGLYLIDVSW